MQIRVIFHSILREKLPTEARGTALLELEEGARVQEIFDRFHLSDTVVWAINDHMQRDRTLLLKDGDTIRFLRPGAGG